MFLQTRVQHIDEGSWNNPGELTDNDQKSDSAVLCKFMYPPTTHCRGTTPFMLYGVTVFLMFVERKNCTKTSKSCININIREDPPSQRDKVSTRLVRWEHWVLLIGQNLLMGFNRVTFPDGMCMCMCIYVCTSMVITYSGVWINRIRLPILLVVS